MAADMSYRLGWIDAVLLQRIRALNEKAKLPVVPPPVSKRLWCGRVFGCLLVAAARLAGGHCGTARNTADS